MKPLPDIGFLQTNDEVPAGTYICMTCQENGIEEPDCIILDEKSKLPECRNCKATYWMEI